MDASRGDRAAVTMRPATTDDAPTLAATFATNLAYLRAAGDVPEDAGSVPASVVADYLDEELARPDGRCLVVQDTQGEAVGTVSMLVPHPREPYPWIGLLLIDGPRQGEGLGTATADVVESLLAAEGWTQVRIGVLENNPSALSFWTRRGYVSYDRTRDRDGRPCTLLSRTLLPPEGPRSLRRGTAE